MLRIEWPPCAGQCHGARSLVGRTFPRKGRQHLAFNPSPRAKSHLEFTPRMRPMIGTPLRPNGREFAQRPDGARRSWSTRGQPKALGMYSSVRVRAYSSCSSQNPRVGGLQPVAVGPLGALDFTAFVVAIRGTTVDPASFTTSCSSPLGLPDAAALRFRSLEWSRFVALEAHYCPVIGG